MYRRDDESKSLRIMSQYTHKGNCEYKTSVPYNNNNNNKFIIKKEKKKKENRKRKLQMSSKNKILISTLVVTYESREGEKVKKGKWRNVIY